MSFEVEKAEGVLFPGDRFQLEVVLAQMFIKSETVGVFVRNVRVNFVIVEHVVQKRVFRQLLINFCRVLRVELSCIYTINFFEKGLSTFLTQLTLTVLRHAEFVRRKCGKVLFFLFVRDIEESSKITAYFLILQIWRQLLVF